MKNLAGLANNLIQVRNEDSGEWKLCSELILMLCEKKYEIVGDKPVALEVFDSQRIFLSKDAVVNLALYLTNIAKEMEKFERVDQQQNDKHSKSKKGV